MYGKKSLGLIGIILIYAAMQTFLAVRYLPINEVERDQALYLGITKNIVNEENTHDQISLSKDVTPFYSLVIALPYFLSDYSLNGVFFFQILLSLFSLILIYKILLSRINTIISILAVTGLILYYPVWSMNFYVMMEIVTIFFLVLTLYCFNLFLLKSKNIFLYFSAALFAILILINNRFLVHFGILTAVGGLLFVVKLKKNSLGQLIQKYKSLIWSVSLVFLILLGWHVRQYSVYKEFIIFTPLWTDVAHKTFSFIPESQIYTEVDYLKDNVGGDFFTYEESLNIIKRTDFAKSDEAEELYTKELHQKLKQDYESTKPIDKYLDRVKNFFKIGNFRVRYQGAGSPRIILPSSIQKNMADVLILLPVFLLFLPGVIFAIINKSYFFNIISLLVMSHFLMHIVVHFIQRYRIPILPLIFIISAYGLLQTYEYINYKRYTFKKA